MTQHPDDKVERVARAIEIELSAGRYCNALYNAREDNAAAALREASIAAIAAMPSPEMRIGDFVLRHAPNGIWIGRTCGEGGEFATEHVERVIAKYYRENF